MTVQRRSASLRISSRTTSPENGSTPRNHAPVLHGPAEWRTRTGRGVRSPSGSQKYGLPGKASTRRMVTKITVLRALGRGQAGLGEQDGRLLDRSPG